MRTPLLVLAAFVLAGAQTPSEPQPFDTASFDAALAAKRLSDAGRMLDLLVQQRVPSDGRPRVDSEISARVGRYAMASGFADEAAAQLSKVDIGQLPATERPSSLVAYAEALESLGDRPGALQTYEAAARLEPTTGAEADRARLGVARLTMIANPGAARTLLRAIGTSTSPWYLTMLRAQAASLAGDRQGAFDAGLIAWNQAAQAPANETAPLKVALLNAGIAAARNDRPAQLAMLTAAGAQSLFPNRQITSRLPVCGDVGLDPSDWLTLAAMRSPFGPNSIFPVAASRPTAIAPLYDSISGMEMLEDSDIHSAGGTLITVSCASAISGFYVPKNAMRDPIRQWLAARGLYSAYLRDMNTEEGVNELAQRIENWELRFGKNSPLLIPMRMQLLTGLQLLQARGEAISRGRIAELAEQVVTGLKMAGAPAELADSYGHLHELHQLRLNSQQRQINLATLEAVLRKLMATMPVGYARALLAEIFSNAPPESSTIQVGLLEVLDARASALEDVRARQAWLLHVASVQRAAGMTEEARKTRRKLKLPAQLCWAADEPPVLLKSSFGSEDFPSDLLNASQQGLSVLEFSVDEDGNAERPRSILSSPSGAFDAVAATKLRDSRYVPAKIGEKAIRCDGMLQRVIWRMPTREEIHPPSFGIPANVDETS